MITELVRARTFSALAQTVQTTKSVVLKRVGNDDGLCKAELIG